MRLVVITPVGPGHEGLASRCASSVIVMSRGPFSAIHHEIVDDTNGRLGRGRARNLGMVDADWYFFLDADDTIYFDAASYINTDFAATFGLVVLNGLSAPSNIYPCGREELIKYGARGTLSMGMFVRADVARDLRFDEDMQIAEDFDFYMRLPDFIKVPEKLVNIRYDEGKGRKSNWKEECRRVIASHVSG